MKKFLWNWIVLFNCLANIGMWALCTAVAQKLMRREITRFIEIAKN